MARGSIKQQRLARETNSAIKRITINDKKKIRYEAKLKRLAEVEPIIISKKKRKNSEIMLPL